MKYNKIRNSDMCDGFANVFNNYFSSVFQVNSVNMLDSSCCPHGINSTNDYLQNQINSSLPNHIDNLLDFISHGEIWQAIWNMKLTNSSSYDGIPIIIYKKSPAIVIDFLSILFNKVMKSNKIPDWWKFSIVLPMFKKGERDTLSNYRPISLLCSISKIFEKVVNSCLHCFFSIQQYFKRNAIWL